MEQREEARCGTDASAAGVPQDLDGDGTDGNADPDDDRSDPEAARATGALNSTVDGPSDRYRCGRVLLPRSARFTLPTDRQRERRHAEHEGHVAPDEDGLHTAPACPRLVFEAEGGVFPPPCGAIKR